GVISRMGIYPTCRIPRRESRLDSPFAHGSVTSSAEPVDIAVRARAAVHAQAAIVTAASHTRAVADRAQLAGQITIGHAHTRLPHVAGRVPAAEAVVAGIDLPRLLRVLARLAGLAVAEQLEAVRLHPASFLGGVEAHGVAAT